MSQQYANTQPQGFKNVLEKVAIVGATGQVGKLYLEELLKLGSHKITAITREESSAQMPDGVSVKRVNYDDPSSLAEALQGQDALIITMGRFAPKDQHLKLVKAAAEAKVPWVIPNEHGVNRDEPELSKDTLIGLQKAADRKQIEELGFSSWIGFCCGFWYEYSLALGSRTYGFDFKERSIVYIDDGMTPINTSTWPQCGRAMAKLLSLKILPDNEHDKSVCLDHFRNSFVRVSSFFVSQKQMMDSVLRVTGDKAEDWKVSYENHKERYNAGMKEMQEGNMLGFGQLLYTRVFYPDGSGSFERDPGSHNELLGLPEEDIDEFTKIAINMTKNK